MGSYQQIDSSISNQHHRRMQQQQQQRNGNDDREETQEDRVQRQIRRQWRLMEMERRQMELAIEQSRRDAFQTTRKQQDEEYQRALREAKENEKVGMGMGMEDEIVHNTTLSNEEYSNEEKLQLNDYEAKEDDIVDLDPLPNECVDDSECVCVRLRLPNGIRSERRFHYSSTIGDICHWTKHLFVEHEQTHLIGNSQLISTMPHTVYDDMDKPIKDLKFWRPNAKRKLVSPLLYVDEL